MTQDGTKTAPTAATPASATAPAPRKGVPFTRRSFEATNSVDRMKQYLKDVPILHKRLSDVVLALERHLVVSGAHLDQAKKTLAEFNSTTEAIKANVARWEEEQKHVGPGHHVPVDPAPGAVPAPAAPAVTAPAPGN